MGQHRRAGRHRNRHPHPPGNGRSRSVDQSRAGEGWALAGTTGWRPEPLKLEQPFTQGSAALVSAQRGPGWREDCRLSAAVAEQCRPLLVTHAPGDREVGVEATAEFLSAK